MESCLKFVSRQYILAKIKVLMKEKNNLYLFESLSKKTRMAFCFVFLISSLVPEIFKFLFKN